ncbi:gelsolin repeat protein [Cooperia oncophora]
MNDESEEFLDLFGGEERVLVPVLGSLVSRSRHMLQASVNGTAVEMEPVPVAMESLDPRYCFLLDAGDTLWIWSGWKARITVANKARLFAERLNKRDRKGVAAIETCRDPKVPEEFWMAFCGSPNRPDEAIVEHVPENFVPERKRLYQVNIGMGFLELPQVDLPKGVAKQELLNTKCVYILDCTSDIFLWMGKKANRLLKMAGQKMVTELHEMIERPDYVQVSRETEVLVKRDNMMRTDLTALFLKERSLFGCQMENSVHFTRWIVMCFSDGRYVKCYKRLKSRRTRAKQETLRGPNRISSGGVVVRMHQQQENHKFLSHFHRKFVIRRGRRGLTRNLGGKWPELFQMRANGSSVCTRTIQIDCRATELCSGFCHILRAPYKVIREDGEKGIVYVWIGKQSDPHEHEYARRVAEEMINRHDECFPVEVIKEGEEPDEFWEYIGGKKK